MELIKMIDLVLENQIIDDSEKEYIIAICENYVMDVGNYFSSIYKLNGIVEGLVCDGVINKEEIFHLKEWMDIYGDKGRCHNPSAELCKAIDDILEDGIVTEEEQTNLLDMLNTRIQNAQFENRLEYLCKLVKEKEKYRY